MEARQPPSFGVSLDPTAEGMETALETAAVADAEGLDLVCCQDHPYHAKHLDSWTLLTVVAARTSRVTVLPNVANLPLRGPQILAKSVATLSRLSDGRADLGLGAGAFWDAVAAYGGPRRSPGESVEALEEAIHVVRLLWDPGAKGDFPGDHYRLAGARPGPAPPDAPRIWIGGYGPRMLDLTGRLADGWTPSEPYAAPDRIPEMRERVDRAATEAGRDPAAIRRCYNLMGLITDGSDDGDGIVGDPDHWVRTLLRFRDELGFDTFVFWPRSDAVAQTHRFATEVVPEVRERPG